VDLAAIEEIRQLKYRYFRALDLKQWDEFADTLADDVVGRYGTHAMGEPLAFDGRDTVTKFMRDALGPAITTVHVANHPEIVVDGDTATGSWLFEDTVIATEHRILIRGAGYYDDRYRRDADGRWRIAATSYKRIYESMQSLNDTPSFQLLANMWAASPPSPQQ
jgi:ketosteroid isomerase-like protein